LVADGLVRNILADEKIETRRPMSPQPVLTTRNGLAWQEKDGYYGKEGMDRLIAKCPYGVVGETLWVRETWAPLSAYVGVDPGTTALAANGFYRADFPSGLHNDDGTPVKWKPSIHMPRSRARLFLEITEVRVERVQEIDDDGAIREGFKTESHVTALERFIDTWDIIYGAPERATSRINPLVWAKNPWVWVICFRRIRS
jgi:hypothetical protein